MYSCKTKITVWIINISKQLSISIKRHIKAVGISVYTIIQIRIL